MSPEWLLDYIRAQWKTVKAAPGAFIAALVLGSIVGGGGIRWLVAERLAFLQDEVNGYKDKLHDASPSEAAGTINTLRAKVEELQRNLGEAQQKSKQQDTQMLKLHTDLDATKSLLTTIQKQNRLEIAGDQMKKLLTALDHVPLGQTYYVAFEVSRDCMDCEIFANNLSGPWGHLRGWRLRGEVNRRIYPMSGMLLPWNSNQCPEAEMTLIKTALDKAGILYENGQVPDYLNDAPPGHCLIVVGAP
jgi:hypothetical protein